MRVTIKQIAEEAGVSLTTVSNVINNKKNRISEEKREAILKIIEKYGYTPNMNARALVHSRSSLIGLIYYSDRDSFEYTDPFVAEILAGIEQIARETGYFILVNRVTSVEDIEVIQRNWRFEGFVAVGASEEFYQKCIGRIHSPTIFIDAHIPKEKYRDVMIEHQQLLLNTDDYQMGYKATEYLIQKQHKRIAFFAYAFDYDKPNVIQQRYKGYLSALAGGNLTHNEADVYIREDIKRLADDIDQFTAIVASSDFLAIECIHYLKGQKKYKKEKTAMISFDDIRYAQLFSPPLTTIRLNQLQKGKIAMEMLLEIIQNPEKEILHHRTLTGELVVRESG